MRLIILVQLEIYFLLNLELYQTILRNMYPICKAKSYVHEMTKEILNICIK